MKAKTRHNFANAFGALGIFSAVLQWVWALILLLPPLLKIDSVHTFIMPSESTQAVAHTPTPVMLPPFFTFLLIAFSFVIVLVGIYFAIKSPTYVVNSVDKSTRKAAASIARRTVKHPEKTREIHKISRRILWAIKWGAVLLGLIVVVIDTRLTTSLSPEIILTVGAYLTIWPIFWFGLQYLVEPRTHAK